MMKRKKIAILVLIACLISGMTMLTSCNDTKQQAENLSDKINNKLDAYKTDLMDSSDTMKTNKNIQRYLTSWAKSKGISYTQDSAGNVIMTVKASSDYKDAKPTVIICPYDKSQFNNYIDPVAMALYTVKNNENTGKLTVVFTKENGHDFAGIKALSSRYFTNDTRVFCLNGGQKGLFATKSGAGSTYRFTQSISHASPSLTKTYKITVSGLPGGQPDSKISATINPITKLESLLASLKSSNISYELASFTGGNNDSLYARSATMTIVVDANKEEAFIEKMDKQTKNFIEKNKETYPDITYTYKKTSLPSSVISSTNTSKFVNFMYTLFDGVYYKDDDGNLVSINNISYIRTTGSAIKINSVAYSLDTANLKEIDTNEKTLCSLSGIGFKKTGSIPLWLGKSDTTFTKAVSDAYNSFSGQSLTYTDSVTPSSASFVKSKNSKCSIIAVTVNANVVKDCTGSIITYLMNSNSSDK